MRQEVRHDKGDTLKMGIQDQYHGVILKRHSLIIHFTRDLTGEENAEAAYPGGVPVLVSHLPAIRTQPHDIFYI